MITTVILYLDVNRYLEMHWNVKVTVLSIVGGVFETISKVLGKDAQRNNCNNSNDRTVKISKNTKKRPAIWGDLL